MPSSYTSLHYHLVFGTKNREPFITREIREKLYRFIGGIVVRQRGVLVEIGGMPDHVHALVGLPASLSVAEAAKSIKGSSSRWVGKEFGVVFGWQPGYGGLTVSESQLQRVRRYIQRQAEHHRHVSFQEEMLQLLNRHHLGLSREDA